MDLYVSEIFHSIQGESVLSGRPCTFIRLSGCNLRCTYCDTPYAYKQELKMSFEEILSCVDRFGCPLVEITGGEPLFQKNTPLLVTTLLEKGYEVMLETNGTYDLELIDTRCIKIVDIKCPGSGEEKNNDLENLKKLAPDDQAKFVIGSREDYEYAKTIIPLLDAAFPRDHILFSPVVKQLDPAVLSQWILEDHLNVRLNMQLHKIIWPDRERGV